MEELAIKVENVSKTFKLPHEKNSSIKSSVINFYRKEKGYEVQKALNNVSFEVKKGDFFAIVGRNGSGKSTLLKLLAGIYTSTKGDIHIRGSLTPFIELGVGFNPELTGRENVYLNGALLGFNRQEMRAMYSDIVEFAELGKFMDQKLKNYSSGMQVRLAFSIAIRAKSDILLLDEVLAVGDAAFQQKCFNYFEELKSQNQTVVFVSHDMGSVRRFCNRAVLIQDGQIIKEGNAYEIADAYQEINLINDSPDRNKKKNETVDISIVNNNKKMHELDFRINFKIPNNTRAYLGFSILKDGITFAELNSIKKGKLPSKGRLIYRLDTSMLNPGYYEISAALLKEKTQEQLGITTKRAGFTIEGYDNTRGGAISLADSWVD